ncbi:lysM domain receptor-like kinase 4 [Pyrus ussuriensis x Pyrus communis]|uniref:LysM domain receptor-like kinase 4 n=1 Tax=Pyrus ussuriensis x Pyrus communis TaxID=2448454 RepID=A0A5N5GGV4_9ROSA|nr:lysM domain receptor-like kinase 4 [Pyrus ussuriensis x Pyrus communis]
MIYLCLLILLCLSSSYGQQYYDQFECAADASYLGSRYTCNMEVVIPITCSCSDGKFQLQSFAKHSFTLKKENMSQENKLMVGTELHVRLRCACPEKLANSSGVKYLVTYPFVEGDGPVTLSQKFSISPEVLLSVNHLVPSKIVFPNTTVLVPLRAEPLLNFNIQHSPPPAPAFLPIISVENSNRNVKLVKKLYVVGYVVGFSLLLAALTAFVILENHRLYCLSSPISCSTVRSPNKSGQTGRSSSISSCLSQDILAGLKYSLFNYSIEELRRATRDFNEENKIGSQVLNSLSGMINNVEVMINQMRFEDPSHVIDVHSKINHIKIVNLEAVSYGENHMSWSYLVFKFPSNGCLRGCLSSPSSPLKWYQRTQIALDIATGLHYLHRCTFPSCAHLDISTRNIFVTANWRAKLSNIGSISALGSSEGNDKGWKVDIFAFGVVLLELIPAREDIDGKLFKESFKFLGGGASEGGFLDQLRSFIDPQLEDYPLAEASCLAVSAKACVEHDPLHRPSIDDIMKVLARMV